MKTKILQIGLLALLTLATGCSTYLYQSDAYALDDMYGVTDQEAIARQRQAEAEKRQAEEEARQAAIAALLSSNGTNSDVLADTYDSAYSHRIRGFNSLTYQRPSSSYDQIRTDSQFEYLSAYDPAYYNIIVLGDEVWVEPKYITSMFDSWDTPNVTLNFGLGFSSVYDYNDMYFRWWYNPYNYGWRDPYWAWCNGNYGFYGFYCNPFSTYPWYYPYWPYWDPFWYYPPYWAYGPGWWGGHPHHPGYPGHVATRPNYRRNPNNPRLASGSFSGSGGGRSFGNSGYRGSSSSVGRGSFSSGRAGSSTFRGGSSSNRQNSGNAIRPVTNVSFTNKVSFEGSGSFSRGNNSPSRNGSSSFRGGSSTRSTYSAPLPTPSRSSFSGGSFGGGGGSRGGGGGGGGRTYGR